MHRDPRTPTRASWLAAALAFSLVACEGAGDDGGSGSGSGTADEFATVIPTTGDLELALDEDGAAAQPLSAAEHALEGEPSRVRAATREVFERVNDAVRRTMDRVRELVEGTEPEEIAVGGFECKRWEVDGERAHWRLTSCLRDRRQKVFAFRLEGRPLDAGEEDYLRVLAGEGRLLPQPRGGGDDARGRRGAGRIGYDFDNLNALIGEGPTGRVGFGYRRTGQVRFLNVGLRDFQREGDATATSALYRYRQHIGRGGHVRLLADADLVARDEDGALVRGRDDVTERARIAIGWKRGEGARAAVVLCGGTVGDGECVRMRQCWTRDGEVAHEDLAADPDARPEFDRRACAPVPEPVEEAPAEGEVLPPEGEGEDIPGPVVLEPAEDE